MIAKFLVALVVAWLGWRLWHGPTRRAARPIERDRDLTRARALLGVGVAAGEGEIRAAHRRLVSAAHPDRGGSTEEARRLNTARDLLLRYASTENSSAI